MIEYRPAVPQDAEAVALLHTRSWRENYRGAFEDAFLDGDLPEERLRVWRKRLHDPPWGSFNDNLHVARASQRQGIGLSLMGQARGWLGPNYSDLGVYLWVLEANSFARRFYQRLGAHNAGATIMETHGGAMVRSCRYTWPRAELLCAA